MQWMDDLELSAAETIAQGANRLVYQHPTEPGLLVKVIKPGNSDERKARKRKINRPALIRFGALRTWQREYNEYIALMWRNGTLPGFIPRFFGFCDTDVGPGMIVEKIAEIDGTLSPTLSACCAQGRASQALYDQVSDFFDEMDASGCIASGIHSRNIVVRDGGAQLYLVDGLGEIVLIKTQWMSDRLRLRNMDKHRQAMLAEVWRAMGQKDS